MTLAPGQGALKPNIFRIGHIGWFDIFDIAAALAAVELSLTELGADIERGVAVRGRSRRTSSASSPRRPMWPEPVERVARELRAAAAEATIQEFPHGTPTARTAAKAIGCSLAQIVKSIVFVCDGAYVVALVPGDRRADERDVAEAVGRREVRVAHGRGGPRCDRLRAWRGRAVPAPAVAAVLMERTLLQHGKVWIGAARTRTWRASRRASCSAWRGARTADLLG